MITKKKKRWGITFGFKIEKLDELNVWMCVPLSGWTRCICAVCGVQYIPIYILISHTHTSASASPWGTDGRVASSLLIITVCDLARGKAGRRRVHWGMQLSWERRRAAGQHEKHWSSQSGLPVWCQSTPRPGLLFEGRNFVFFPLSLSLSVLTASLCTQLDTVSMET